MTVVQRDRARIFKIVIYSLWISVFSAGIYLVWVNYSSNLHYQPVQDTAFSHKVHSGDYGIKCISCHSGAEEGQAAGIPGIDDCMSCHIMLKYESDKLKIIVDSYENLKLAKWTKIHDTPDYVKYNHGIHVQAGIDCATCHGEVEKKDTMSLTNNHEMKWCVNCHRDPKISLIVTREISGVHLKNIIHIHDSLDLVTRRQIQQGKITCSGCHF